MFYLLGMIESRNPDFTSCPVSVLKKYIYSRTVPKYSFKVLVLDLSMYLHVLNYISEGNTVLFTPLHFIANFTL